MYDSINFHKNNLLNSVLSLSVSNKKEKNIDRYIKVIKEFVFKKKKYIKQIINKKNIILPNNEMANDLDNLNFNYDIY